MPTEPPLGSRIDSRGPGPACPGYTPRKRPPETETTSFQINIVASFCMLYAPPQGFLPANHGPGLPNPPPPMRRCRSTSTTTKHHDTARQSTFLEGCWAMITSAPSPLVVWSYCATRVGLPSTHPQTPQDCWDYWWNVVTRCWSQRASAVAPRYPPGRAPSQPRI